MFFALALADITLYSLSLCQSLYVLGDMFGGYYVTLKDLRTSIGLFIFGAVLTVVIICLQESLKDDE